MGAAGRAFTVGTAPVAALLAGAIGEVLGLRLSAVVAGLGVVAAFVWLVISPVRSLRSLSGESGACEGGPPPAEPPGKSPEGAPDPRQPVAERV